MFIIQILVIAKLGLLCIAECYKEITQIRVTQHFEIISKAYETSQQEAPEIKEDIWPSRNLTARPFSALALLLLICGLWLQGKSFPFLHDIPGMCLPGNEGSIMFDC